MNRFLVEETGKEQSQQVLRNGDNGMVGRQVFAVQMVDAADARVGGDQLIRQFGDSVHGGII